jgi:flagellar basal body rod protein FlgG
MDGYFNAYAALDARIKILDLVANNLANAQTAGFTRDFGLMVQGEDGFQVGSSIDMTEGALINTGNDLDAAIDGSGFFTIQTDAGVRYTRAGSFFRDAQGDLVTKDGAKVLASDGSPISVSDGTVAIHDGGVVTLNGNEIATLKIVSFPNLSKLQRDGLDRFQWTGTPDEMGTVSEPPVKGGCIEQSNVNPVTEMVHLMSAYREFEAVQRTVKTLMIDMNGKLIQELGKLTS